MAKTPIQIQPGLYHDDEGNVITTHSMIKTMARCPKQAQYKYHERLKRRFVTARQKPLKRGTWFHSLLEEYYAGRDWKAKHRELSLQYAELFDEEKDALGDLPRECLRLMKSYLWHYGADKSDPYHGWDVKGTELTLECPWPDGEGIYRCRLDIMYEDEWGLWIGDHKTHKALPGHTQRLQDYASALYIWCARENGYPVQGFVWNYIKTKPPTVPQLAYEGTSRERLSVAKVETDYPTFYLAVKGYIENGSSITMADYAQQLRALKSQRWKRGEVQSSPFFRRDTLEKDDAMLARVVASAMRTRDRMHGYDFSDAESVERTTDRSCEWMCDYTDVCTAELFYGDASVIRKQQFRTGDPLDYYQEQKDSSD